MPTSPAAQANKVLAQSVANLQAAHRRAVTDGAKVVRKVLLKELDQAVSGRRLKGMTGSAKLGIGFVVSSSANGAEATIRATGPWHLIERGTKPHVIRPRKKKALSFGGRAYARVNHPGTKGRPIFAKARASLAPKVDKILAERYIKAVGDAWGG